MFHQLRKHVGYGLGIMALFGGMVLEEPVVEAAWHNPSVLRARSQVRLFTGDIEGAVHLARQAAQREQMCARSGS